METPLKVLILVTFFLTLMLMVFGIDWRTGQTEESSPSTDIESPKQVEFQEEVYEDETDELKDKYAALQSRCARDSELCKEKVVEAKNKISFLNTAIAEYAKNYDFVNKYQEQLEEKIKTNTSASDSYRKSKRKFCGTNYGETKDCDSEFKIYCSASMSLVFTCWNAIVIYETSRLNVGDIIVYKLPESFEDADGYQLDYLIHRIVAINDTIEDKRFITRGDNNYESDLFQPSDSDILGKVVEIDY